MTIYWWYWLVLGFILVALEMAGSGGFYMVFFGIAAIVLSVLNLVGLGGPLWVQLILFSVIAMASLLCCAIRWSGG